MQPEAAAADPQGMPSGPIDLQAALLLATGSLLFVLGGMRFRRWAVDDRPGIPRFSSHVETIVLWLLYSGVVSFAIVVVRQTLREI